MTPAVMTHRPLLPPSNCSSLPLVAIKALSVLILWQGGPELHVGLWQNPVTWPLPFKLDLSYHPPPHAHIHWEKKNTHTHNAREQAASSEREAERGNYAKGMTTTISESLRHIWLTPDLQRGRFVKAVDRVRLKWVCRKEDNMLKSTKY